MPCSRLLLTLLAYGESRGLREEIVGDLLEEIATGRSRTWVCVQVIGLFASAAVDRVRARARVTPPGVAIALGTVWLAGVSMTSVDRAIEAWLVVYYGTGMLSLFAHMAASARGARTDDLGAEP